MYDENNIFAKIIKKEIPCKLIYENDHSLSFHDINPKAKIHALVIPKGHYQNIIDFSLQASDAEKIAIFENINKTIKKLGLEEGLRVSSNNKEIASQEVPHLHFHLMGGEKLPPMQ